MLVNRDSFARQELHRESVDGECSFCGSSNRYGKVWSYSIETDGGTVFPISGTFCCKGCLEAYHD